MKVKALGFGCLAFANKIKCTATQEVLSEMSYALEAGGIAALQTIWAEYDTSAKLIDGLALELTIQVVSVSHYRHQTAWPWRRPSGSLQMGRIAMKLLSQNLDFWTGILRLAT